jgi:type I restriction enzyme R subunit
MSEKGVTKDFLERLEGLGWRESAYCPRIVRENVIIDEIFEESFRKLNRKVLASEGLEDRMDVVLSKVKEMLVRAEPHEFLEYLRSGLSVEEGRKRVKVTLIDYENINNNDFTVCKEVNFLNERYEVRRLDAILYVNGIPLVAIEVEDPLRLGEKALEEGISQLYRYEKEIPWLFKYVQIGVVYTDVENSVYMPMMRDWRGRERWFGKWRDFNGNYNILDLLERERLLDILRWFIFYKGKEKKDKVIPRYNQYWATVKSVKRIVNYLEGRDARNRGLIWHWQGSGKTYIMFYIAYQFYRRFFEEDPIVFFIVDRKELQRQLYDEFIKDIYAPYFQEYIKIVESIEGLKSILNEIKMKEVSRLAIGRGVYVVLIQKFRPEELKELLPIDKREILVLLDEAHRSQYGVLGATLDGILPNAIEFAFTGTPIMGYERNTFWRFAYPSKGELFLDKYFISDSIKDGYTLPLVHRVVRETETKGVKVNVSQDEIKDLLNTWAKNACEVGSLDDLVDEEDERVFITVTKREIRQKLNKIRVFLENPKRLSLVAEYIADNVREDTEDFKFKAIVVVSSRLACVRMKRALDEALTKRYGEEARKWSEVVMTYLSNEREEEIRNYLDELLGRWRGAGDKVVKDWDEVNRIIQDSFKEKEEPRILIVTDMLITGFDCPKLKVMYLDKSLFEHKLLQAIARVNRPYKTQNIIKEFGLIVDFMDLLNNVKETIVKYELLDMEVYKKIFEESIHTSRDVLGELKQLIDEIKQKLATGVNIGNHKVELNIDEIIELVNKGLDSQVYTKLIDASSLLAMGCKSYDPNVIDLLAKMRRACNLYKALGAFKDKLEFHSYIVIITKLYNGITHYMKGAKLPDSFWKELLKMVHDKTSIPEIKLIEEFVIEPASLEEISKKMEMTKLYDPQMKYVAAEAILTIRGLLDLEPANPVYKHIYERLKKLEEEWARRVDSRLIGGIKEIMSDLSDYLRKRATMKLNDRLIYDVKEFLRRRFNMVVAKLEFLEPTLNDVIEKYKSLKVAKPIFFDIDRKNVKSALLKDLFKMGLKDPRQAQRIADELTEYIEREVIRELQKRY